MPEHDVFTHGAAVAQTAQAALADNLVMTNLMTPWTPDDVVGEIMTADGFVARFPIEGKLDARTIGIGPVKNNTKDVGGFNADGSRKRIVLDTTSDTYVTRSIDKEVYSALPITDELYRLGPQGIWDKLTRRQTKAVRDGVEIQLVNTMVAQPFASVTVANSDDPYDVFVDVGTDLRDANVPGEIYAVLGSNYAKWVKKSDTVKRYDVAGDRSQTALARATIAELAGLTIIDGTGTGIPKDFAAIVTKTATNYISVGKYVPRGAVDGGTDVADGIAVTWIYDYDAELRQDRSILSTYLGSGGLIEGKDANNSNAPVNIRGYKLTGVTA